MISYSQLNECVSQVENDPLNQKKVVDTTLGVLQQYAFKNLVKDSGTPYNIKVNLVSELEKNQIATYTTDFEMHQAINSLLAKLLDPHTMYFKPSCYSSFWVLNPFQITVFPNPVDGEDPIVYITSTNFGGNPAFINLYEEITGIDLKPFVGKQVEEINGINAWGYILQESKKVWISKDHSAQINEYLAVDWFQRHLAFESIPPTKNINLTIELEQYSFEYVAFSTSIFLDTEDFNKTCFDEYFESLDDQEPIDSKKILGRIYDEESNLNVTIPRTNEVGLSIYCKNQLPGSLKFGILRIYSFNPKSMDSFKNTVDECFDYLSQNNVEYLIIDVRENGGGYIELGHELFYYLFENQKGKFTPKISNNDVIHSPLHDEFFTKCAQDEKGKEDDTMPFSPKSWYDVNENQFETIELYSPGKEYHRGGGLPQSFSTFFHENVDFLWENKNKLYYDKHHLLILSDGRCGSTCAIFTSKVFQNGLAKTITIGGNGNKTVNASAISFPGGQVLDDYFFHIVYLYFVDNLKIPIDNMFDEYPSDQSLSFTWREIYPMDKNPDESNPIPMEFQFYPSDIHIFNWDFNNDESIIAESVTHFNFSSYKPTPTPTYTPSPTPTSSPTTTANPTTKDDTNMKSFKVGISILAILLIISFIFIIFLFINIRKLKHKNHHELLEGQTDDSEDEFEFELESAKNSNIDNENDDENTFESEKENSDQEDQENDKLIN